MSLTLNNSIYTDRELVSLSLINQDHFTILVNRYEEKISRYIKRITYVTQEDEQDMLQNIFIKVYTNLNDFDKNLSFNSWIYRIAHNEIIDWSRKAKTKIKYGHRDYSDEIYEWTEDTHHFLKALDIQEKNIHIYSVLQKLDIKYREVLTLKFIEGYSYREMSDILKKPEGTIATLINRAKKSFKEYYE